MQRENGEGREGKIAIGLRPDESQVVILIDDMEIPLPHHAAKKLGESLIAMAAMASYEEQTRAVIQEAMAALAPSGSPTASETVAIMVTEIRERVFRTRDHTVFDGRPARLAKAV